MKSEKFATAIVNILNKQQMKKKFILAMALLTGAMTFTSCSSDDDKDNEETAFSVSETKPMLDDDNYSGKTDYWEFCRIASY